MSDYSQKDPLEELFQQKAREYDISYRESDWKSLENRLDALDAQHAARKKRNIAAAVILLVFSALAYATYHNYQTINALNKKIAQTEEPSEPSVQSDKPKLKSGQSAAPPPASSVPDNSGSKEEQNDEILASTAVDSSRFDNKSAPSRTYYNSDSMTELAVKEVNCPNCTLTDFEARFMIDQSGIALASLPNKKAKSPPPARDPAFSPSAEISSSRNGPRASLGLVAGPDLSTVGSVSNFYNPGFKLGVVLDYHLSKNFSISLGAIRSNVRYTAKGGEYKPPSGYWNYGIQASKTFAQCILVDIPLNIAYRFVNFEHSRLYASAGLSSYIMLSEDYQFQYKSSNSGLPRQWKEKTGTTHLMSNASFSVGYELDIAPKLSVRAEPFLRLPIKEVGWGNVNLYSVGSLISVNYHLY